MAEKIFTNVRLGLKVDTLENWGKSSLVLKKGEVAFATVAATAGTGLTEPVCMMKIGDGEHTFAELGFDFYAKAADVLAACKSEDSLKAFVNGVIADAGIASDEAMQELAGKVTVAEGKITTLEGKMTAVEGKAAANEAAIEAIEDRFGADTVALEISNAIAALDLPNTYAAKTHGHVIGDVEGLSDSIAAAKKAGTDANAALEAYKTLNDAAVKVNSDAIAGIKNGETLDNFKEVEEALAGKQAAGNYSVEGHKHEIADVNGLADSIADAKKAGTDASVAAGQSLVDAKQYTDDEMTRLVGDTKVSEQISGAITDLDLANTYAAKEHKHVKADITDFSHNHEMAEVNGLVDALAGKQAVGDYATKAEAQGYANAKDEAIAAAQKAGDDAQADVDALAELVGTLPEGAGVATVVAYVDKKTSGIATDVALGELTERVGAAEQAIDAIEADYLKKADKDELAGDIADLGELVGDKKVSEQIAAITNPIDTRLATVEGDYLKASDKTELEGKIKSNADAIELLTNGVSAEEVDGVNDLIQYVKDHGTEVTGIQADIKANSDAIATEKLRAEGIESGLDTRLQAVESAVGETGSVATAIESAVTESKEYADDKVKALADGAVKTNADDIAALELKVGDKTVSEQIEAAIEDAKTDASNKDAVILAELTAHTGDGDVHVTTADKTTWNAAVQTVTAAADSGLKAVKTGTDVAIEIDDTIVWVFDCGGAE